jgi:methionine biosynthesis protein MetW
MNNKNQINGINKQDVLYDSKTFGKFKPHRFKKIIKYIPSKKLKLLDVACGEGQFYDLLKNHRKNVEYVGVDFSNKQVEIAKKKGYNAKIQDVTKKWDFEDQTFDVIICSEIIEHIFDTDFFLKEVNRVLKINGTLILTTPNIASAGDRLRLLFGKRPSAIEFTARIKDSGHIRAFVYEDIKKLFKFNGFRDIKILGRDFYMPIFRHEMKYLGKINVFFAKWFPKLSAGFIIIAKK